MANRRFTLILSKGFEAKQSDAHIYASSAGNKAVKAYRDRYSLACFAKAEKPLWMKALELVRA